ncbi:MAG TPA: hypothetical protein PKW90_22195, partial [Myxococcota bacterium]|nr:hypothetical protein [Myxococcota bacterium]
MVLLDNLSKLIEPLLVLACAGVYAGGGWGSFKLAESFAYLLFRTSLLGLDRGVVWWFGKREESQYQRDLAAVIQLVLAVSLLGALVLVGLSHLGSMEIRGLSLSLSETFMIAAAIPALALAEILFQANLNRQNLTFRILGKNLVHPLVTFGGALLSHRLGGPGLPF